MNNLGNFINRGLTFVQKFYDSKVPVAQIDGTMRTWCKEVNDLLKEYFECMEKNNQREGLRTILSISKLGNKLIQVWQPWVKVKSKVKILLLILYVELAEVGSVIFSNLWLSCSRSRIS